MKIVINGKTHTTTATHRINHLKKMQKAVELLEEGMHISHVSDELGYTTLKSLRKALLAIGYSKEVVRKPMDMKKVKSAIEEHLGGCSMPSISKKMGVSDTWLSLVMKKEFGYIVNQRNYSKSTYDRKSEERTGKADLWDRMLLTPNTMRFV